jgi:hypothetical protein
MVITINRKDSISLMKKKLNTLTSSIKPKKLFDAKKFNGVLKFKINPLKIQRKLRKD